MGRKYYYYEPGSAPYEKTVRVHAWKACIVGARMLGLEVRRWPMGDNPAHGSRCLVCDVSILEGKLRLKAEDGDE